jgi:hypothetical protein
VRTDQVDLKLTKFFRRDRDLGKRAKPGVYAVNDFASRDNVFDKAASPLYAGSRSGGERHYGSIRDLGGLLEGK